MGIECSFRGQTTTPRTRRSQSKGTTEYRMIDANVFATYEAGRPRLKTIGNAIVHHADFCSCPLGAVYVVDVHTRHAAHDNHTPYSLQSIFQVLCPYVNL